MLREDRQTMKLGERERERERETNRSLLLPVTALYYQLFSLPLHKNTSINKKMLTQYLRISISNKYVKCITLNK
jgi:hypothetical protein